MIVSVALAIPIQKTFSYSVPQYLEPFIKPYMRIAVPFHNRALKGYIVGIEEGSGDALKEILGLVDFFPLFSSPVVSLCLWASQYYAAPLGQILKYAVPLNLPVEQYLIVKSLCDQWGQLDGSLVRKVLKTRRKEEIMALYQARMIDFYDVFSKNPFVSAIPEPARTEKHSKNLYMGGIDGRIEHYLALISRHTMRKENVLVILPDYYASGRYFYKIISDKFKGRVYWYGSPEKPKARAEAYFRARNAGGMVILGNRSAAFLPLFNIGLIIVEKAEADEHRNEEGVRFNAWTAALKRAEFEDVPIVLGSAAAPLEVYKSVSEGKYTITDKTITVKRERIDVVKKRQLSVPGRLPEALTNILSDAAKGQKNIAIFTPRRFYASYLYCLFCKTSLLCNACGGHLCYQKEGNMLVCPACGERTDYPNKCPDCGSESVSFSQTGVEYIAGKIEDAFLQTRIVKVTGDILEDVIKKEDIYKTFKTFGHSRQNVQGEAAKPVGPVIFVGTQALAKLYGIKIDQLILFGWEQMMRFSGYRAFEKMFQTLMSLIDTLMPDRICFFMDEKNAVDVGQFIDSAMFYKNELQKRKFAEYPPYVRLFLITAEKKEKHAAERLAEKIRNLIKIQGFEKNISGIFIEKRGNSYQFKMIARFPEDSPFPDNLTDIYSIPDVRIEPDPPSV